MNIFKTISFALIAFSFLAVLTPSKSYSNLNPPCIIAFEKLAEPIDYNKAFDQTDEVGYRGFRGDNIPVNVQSKQAAQKRGADHWRIAIYVVPTIEEAEAHMAMEGNLLVKGLYIVSKDANLMRVFDKKASQIPREEAYQIFKRLYDSPDFAMYEPDPKLDLHKYNPGQKIKFSEQDAEKAIQEVVGPNHPAQIPLTNLEMRRVQEKIYANYNASAELNKTEVAKPGDKIRLVRIAPDKVKRLFDPEKVTLFDDMERQEVYADGSLGQPEKFFFHPGWTAPKFRGIIWRRWTKGSSTHKEILKWIKKSETLGYAVTINAGHKESFELLSVQDRRGSHILTGKSVIKDPTTNRFRAEKLPERTKEFSEFYQNGKAFSVEFWSPAHPKTGKRILLGSAVGENVGELYYPDTVAYNTMFAEAILLETNPERAQNDLEEKIADVTPEEMAMMRARMAEYRAFVKDVVDDAIAKNPKTDPKDVFLKLRAIDYAKIPMHVIGAKLAKEDVNLFDAYMTTGFTEGLGAELVYRNQFERIAKILRKKPPQTLMGVSGWSAADSPDYKEPEQGKKKNKKPEVKK